MGLITQSIAPVKFLSSISLILVMITIFWTYKQNLLAGLSKTYSDSEYNDAQASIFICVILSVVMVSFQVFMLLFGLSLFNDTLNLIQVILTLTGTILTSWFILDDWDYSGLWAIWFFTIFLATLLDLPNLTKSKF